MSPPSLTQALESFCLTLRGRGFHSLEQAFEHYAAGDTPLYAVAIQFCQGAGLRADEHEIIGDLMGVGPHRFHHAEESLRKAWQGDMPALADMIVQDARATYADLAQHTPRGPFPPFPAYLRE